MYPVAVALKRVRVARGLWLKNKLKWVMSLPGSALFVSVSSGRRYLNPANPACVSAWNLQLSVISQILPHLEVQPGEGWRLWSCWEKAENSSKCFGGFCAEF